MSFVYTLALGVALLVALPYLAHRLRRKRAEEQTFAAARLAPPAPPKARRRSKLEDRALFATRALAVGALALLGAKPLLSCSRLSLSRSGGASVALAIVFDDSMSMRAPVGPRAGSRFERAREGARQLLASAREGDAVAIVLAGQPARVALAATTDLGTARLALAQLAPSDRATDLDGAIAMAKTLIGSLPQVDRRVVVLSDLADGNPDGPPIGDEGAIPLWVPLPELRGKMDDCAILSADRSGGRVRVRVECAGGSGAGAREVVLVDTDKKIVARAPAKVAEGGRSGEVSLSLPGDDSKALVARLTGDDAIAADDEAPVVIEAGPGAVAVIADTADEAAATGGAPVVEQALAALRLEVVVRPIPGVPDRAEDFAPFVGVILDDPPGLTPEQRHALSTLFDNGGIALLAVGPHAAAAPLGASLEPVLSRGVSWSVNPVSGADPASATGPFVEASPSLGELGAPKRAVLAGEDVPVVEPLVKWKDGAPLVATRNIGRGKAWIVTLPFAVDASDLTLRPAFLALLDAWVAEAKERAAPRRSDVGTAWTFAGVRSVSAEGPAGAVAITDDPAGARFSPALIGAYRLKVDGKSELRVAAPIAREIDLRPRAAAPAATGTAIGDAHSAVDISWQIALVLLAIMTVEMALRVWSRRDERGAVEA